MEGKFLTGAILGAAIGGAAAMLFCTKSGQKIKDQVMKNIDFNELLELGAEKLGMPDLSKFTGSKAKSTVKRAAKKALHRKRATR